MPGGYKSHKEGCTCRACSSSNPGEKVLISVRLPVDAVSALKYLKTNFGFSQAELLDAAWAHTYDKISDWDELTQLIARYREESNRPF